MGNFPPHTTTSGPRRCCRLITRRKLVSGRGGGVARPPRQAGAHLDITGRVRSLAATPHMSEPMRSSKPSPCRRRCPAGRRSSCSRMRIWSRPYRSPTQPKRRAAVIARRGVGRFALVLLESDRTFDGLSRPFQSRHNDTPTTRAAPSRRRRPGRRPAALELENLLGRRREEATAAPHRQSESCQGRLVAFRAVFEAWRAAVALSGFPVAMILCAVERAPRSVSPSRAAIATLTRFTDRKSAVRTRAIARRRSARRRRSTRPSATPSSNLGRRVRRGVARSAARRRSPADRQKSTVCRPIIRAAVGRWHRCSGPRELATDVRPGPVLLEHRGERGAQAYALGHLAVTDAYAFALREMPRRWKQRLIHALRHRPASIHPKKCRTCVAPRECATMTTFSPFSSFNSSASRRNCVNQPSRCWSRRGDRRQS